MELVLAVVGDRHYSDWATFSKIVADELERFPATKIVTGDASGVDAMTLNYCLMNNIPYQVYCASRSNFIRMKKDGINAVLVSDWAKEGKAAGPIRNSILMWDTNRVLLLDGGGAGSKSIKKLAKEQGKDIEVWNITPYGDGADVAAGKNNLGGLVTAS